jgi:hypothetical protein
MVMSLTKPLRRESLACESWRPLIAVGRGTAEETRDHLLACPTCSARLAVFRATVNELARAAVPSCEWFENQLDIEQEQAPPELADHVRGCPVCQGRRQTVREATTVVSLGDWFPGCSWVKDRLVRGTLATSIFETHVESCGTCRTRLHVGSELQTQPEQIL